MYVIIIFQIIDGSLILMMIVLLFMFHQYISHRSGAIPEYQRRGKENGRPIGISSIWCIGSLSHICTARTSVVCTNQIMRAAIVPIGHRKSTVTDWKVSKMTKWIMNVLNEMLKHLLLLFICRYYNLDDTVAREVLGKKLSSRHRKDLDEVADRTGIRLKSCRRQFDNIKRIFKMVEEMPGNVTNNIRQHFLLPEELARWAIYHRSDAFTRLMTIFLRLL